MGDEKGRKRGRRRKEGVIRLKHGRGRGEETGLEPETRKQVWQKAEQRSEDAAPLLLCSLTGIPPALYSQRLEMAVSCADSQSHSPSEKLLKHLVGEKRKGKKKHIRVSFHSVLAPALVPFSWLTRTLSQSAGEGYPRDASAECESEVKSKSR